MSLSNSKVKHNTTNMTRKKKNLRQSKHQQEPGDEADTTDEESPSPGSSKGCPHATRSVNMNSIKKAFKSNVKLGECQTCNTESQSLPTKPASSLDTSPKQEGETDDTIIELEEHSIWLCLQCGYQGCGRMSTAKHAMVHHQTPHSDPHDLVVNPDTWSIWCYKCDDEIGMGSARRLSECVETVKKQFKLITKKISQPSVKQVAPVSKVTLELQPQAKDVAKKVEEQPKPVPKKPINGMRTDTPNIMRVKGLSNLGNTCFFNAVMQVLSQCRCFVSILKEHCAVDRKWNIKLTPEQRIKDKESVDVTLSYCGALTDALVKFLDEMGQASQKKNGIVSPAQLFKMVCEKATQFKGYQQQDSHELLRYMLDAVKTEEIKRQRLGLVQAFGLENPSRRDVDKNTKSAFRALSSVTDFTVIEKVFGGQLVSTVQCEECHVTSQVFETFMDLSLPVFEEKPTRPGLHKRANSTDKTEDTTEEGTAYRKAGDNTKQSKHQEKKNKRQMKRDAKKQLKSQKTLSTATLLSEEKSEETPTAESSKTGEQCEDDDDDDKDLSASEGQNGDSIESSFPELEVYVTEADVEDNDETSSHHSQGSSRSQNESDLSSLSPSDTVCASGSTTVESDLTATENMEDLSAQASEINSLCQKVASLDLNAPKQSREGHLLDSSGTANVLTSPSSVEVASTDSGIVGSSTDSGIFQKCEKRVSQTHHNATHKYNQELLTSSLTPLAPPCKMASQECSVLSCLHQFTIRELLMGNNKFGCENCTRRKAERSGVKLDDKHPMVYTNASKQLLVSNPPAVLTLQLKRFQQVGRNLMKVNRYVQFPLLLDLAPFCSRLVLALPHVHKGQKQIIYSLIGVVEHSGKLTGGHYTAFVKVQPQQQVAGHFPFLNQKLMSEKELQFLLQEVEQKHDSDISWEMYTDLGGQESGLLFDQPQSPEVPPGKWFHISDSQVTETSESAVLRCKAYLLFYERVL